MIHIRSEVQFWRVAVDHVKWNGRRSAIFWVYFRFFTLQLGSSIHLVSCIGRGWLRSNTAERNWKKKNHTKSPVYWIVYSIQVLVNTNKDGSKMNSIESIVLKTNISNRVTRNRVHPSSSVIRFVCPFHTNNVLLFAVSILQEVDSFCFHRNPVDLEYSIFCQHPFVFII